jgi:hypothetical protein
VVTRGDIARETASETFAAGNPHFVIFFITLAIIDSFSHFLTVPDDTNSSERAVIPVGTYG